MEFLENDRSKLVAEFKDQDPFAAAEYRCAMHTESSVSSFAVRWAAQVRQIDSFVCRFGRLPRSYSSGASGVPREAHLHAWVQRQRKKESNLSEFQFLRLDVIPGFSWSPREDQWEALFEATHSFFTKYERQPRRRSSDPQERKLAGWIRSQNRQIVDCRMSQSRVQLVRHWRDELPCPERQAWLALAASRMIDEYGRQTG